MGRMGSTQGTHRRDGMKTNRQLSHAEAETSDYGHAWDFGLQFGDLGDAEDTRYRMGIRLNENDDIKTVGIKLSYMAKVLLDRAEE